MVNKANSKKFLKTAGYMLQRLRIAQGKELDAVGKAVGISRDLLERIEQGDYDMYLDLLFELCDHYQVSTHDFIKDIEEKIKNYEYPRIETSACEIAT